MNGSVRNSVCNPQRVRGDNDMRNLKLTTALAIKAIAIAEDVFAIAVMLLAVGNNWNAGQLAIALITIVGGAEVAKVLVKINYFINKKENKIDS